MRGNQSVFLARKHSRRSASVPSPKSGPPATTTRVGSPPVWESMTLTLRRVVDMVLRFIEVTRHRDNRKTDYTTTWNAGAFGRGRGNAGGVSRRPVQCWKSLLPLSCFLSIAPVNISRVRTIWLLLVAGVQCACLATTVQAGTLATLLQAPITSDGYGGLTVSGSTIYATPEHGGLGFGSVFSLETSGGTATTLLTFIGSNGKYPSGDPVVNGSAIYGTTAEGGADNDGTIFSLPVRGGNPTTLWSFSGADGSDPFGSLVLSGSKLYGITRQSGTNGEGSCPVGTSDSSPAVHCWGIRNNRWSSSPVGTTDRSAMTLVSIERRYGTYPLQSAPSLARAIFRVPQSARRPMPKSATRSSPPSTRDGCRRGVVPVVVPATFPELSGARRAADDRRLLPTSVYFWE